MKYRTPPPSTTYNRALVEPLQKKFRNFEMHYVEVPQDPHHFSPSHSASHTLRPELRAMRLAAGFVCAFLLGGAAWANMLRPHHDRQTDGQMGPLAAWLLALAAARGDATSHTEDDSPNERPSPALGTRPFVEDGLASIFTLENPRQGLEKFFLTSQRRWLRTQAPMAKRKPKDAGKLKRIMASRGLSGKIDEIKETLLDMVVRVKSFLEPVDKVLEKYVYRLVPLQEDNEKFLVTKCNEQ
eukprot:g57058.t1